MTAEDALRRVNDGISLLQQGDLNGAEMAFRDATRLDSACAEAHMRLGWLLLWRKENFEAGAEFQSTLRIDPDSAAAHEGLGLVLANEGRHPAAEAEYRQAIRLAPQNAIAYSRLAESLYAQNRNIDAEIAARDAIRLNPNLGTAHVSLGRALQRLGQTNDAEQALRAAVALDLRSADARLALGSLLADARRSPEAEAELREAIRLAPSDADAHRALGRVLSSLGRDSEAAAEFRTATKIAPYSPGAQPDLTALERELGDPTKKWRYRAAVLWQRGRRGKPTGKQRTTVAPAVLLRSPRARWLHRFTAGLIDDIFVPLFGASLAQWHWYWAVAIGAACVAVNGYFEGRTGRSVGKQILGLRTIDGKTGGYIGGGHGVLRRTLHILDYPLIGFLVGLESGRTFADRLMGTVVIWRPATVTTRSKRKMAAMEQKAHRRLKKGWRRTGRGYFFLNVVMLDMAGHPLRRPAWLLWHLTRRRPKRAYVEDDDFPEDETYS
jgi:Flp pilus assembly protein TadD